MGNKMNELLQQIVNILRRIRQISVESKQYFSVSLGEICLLVDWNNGALDIPDSIRVIVPNDADDEPGYLGCIRFDVTASKNTNGVQEATFTFDEAEYDLDGVKGREELLGDIIEGLKDYYPDKIIFEPSSKEFQGTN